jgi:transposase
MEAKELDLLIKIGKSQKLSNRIVKRSKLLSYYLSCNNKRKTNSDLGVSRDKIYKWVKRWESNETERLEQWDLYKKGELKEAAYKRFIISLLEDKKGRGTSTTFSIQEKEKIVALSLENPMDLGLPFTHWTRELLAQEAIARGIVESISGRHISRILKKSAVTSPPK